MREPIETEGEKTMKTKTNGFRNTTEAEAKSKQKTKQLDDKRVVKQIEAILKEIAAGYRMSLKKAVELGELLQKQQERVGFGNWIAWVKANLETPKIMCLKTAERYIQLWEGRDRLDNVSNVSEAYRLLKSPMADSDDEEAKRKEMEEKAKLEAKKRDLELTVTMVTKGAVSFERIVELMEIDQVIQTDEAKKLREKLEKLQLPQVIEQIKEACEEYLTTIS